MDSFSSCAYLLTVLSSLKPLPLVSETLISFSNLPANLLDQPGHPSTDRRKQFKDLNDIIAKKAKKAKKAEKSGDATSPAYSDMTWTEIEPVYAPLIKDVEIAPMNIPEQHLDCLYNNLSIISRAIGAEFKRG